MKKRTVLWTVLFLCAGLSFSPAVPKYETAELSFTSQALPSNPFDWELNCVFTSPTGKKLTIPCFYDGDGNGAQSGRVWKCRYYLDETGTWSYATGGTGDAGLDGQTGNVTVTAPAAGEYGPVKVSTAYPHYFEYEGTGEPVYLQAKFLDQQQDPDLYTHIYLSHTRDNTYRALAIKKQLDYHNKRIDIYLANSGDYGSAGVNPWLSMSDAKAFDLPKMKNWDRWIQDLIDAGLYVHFWFLADDSRTYLDIDGALTEAEYRKLIRYAVARWGGLCHVLWCLSLEYDENSTNLTAWNTYGNYLKNTDPYKHPRSIHQSYKTGIHKFMTQSWCDYVLLQPGNSSTVTSVYNHVLENRNHSANKPVFFEEIGLGTEGTALRQRTWAGFCAGGIGGTGSHLRYLNDFAEATGYFAMDPHNELKKSGDVYILANPGQEYIIYFPDAKNNRTAGIDLSGVSGSINVEWYNPRSGAYTSAPAAAAGSNVSFSCPTNADGHDWVLHLGAFTTYTLSVVNGSGSGTYSKNANAPVTANAPASGKTFDKWTGDITNVADIHAASTTIRMLADATVTATYRTAAQYTLTVTNGSGDGSHYEGTTVGITADTPPVGKVFDRWTGDVSTVADIKAASTTLLMPGANASVTATYMDPPVILIRDVSGSGYLRADNFGEGVAYYTDRSYSPTTVPAEITGAEYIRTPNNASGSTADAAVTFTLTAAATVYIGYDDRATALPDWMNSLGFTAAGKQVITDDSGCDLDLYATALNGGTYTFGGNLQGSAAGAGSNYIIIVPGGTVVPVPEGDRKINIVIKDISGLSSGPWLSSLESADADITWRPELHVTYTHGGKETTRVYKRPIGGSNPLNYWIAADQSSGNFYDRADGTKYQGHKYGDAMLIKKTNGRVGFFQCDLSDLPDNPVITSVTYKGHVEPDEGRSSTGKLGIYQCTAEWTKTSITKSISNYQGSKITELSVADGTFVKGSAWWTWEWDHSLVAYVQAAVSSSAVTESISHTAERYIGLPVLSKTAVTFRNLTDVHTIILTSMQGESVRTHVPRNEQTYRMDTGGLPTGCYVIGIELHDGTRVCRKLLIQ